MAASAGRAPACGAGRGFLGGVQSLAWWHNHQNMPAEFDHIALMVSVGDDPPAGIEPHSQIPTGGTKT